MQIVKVIDATQENAATSFPMILGTDWWESVAEIGAIPIKITQFSFLIYTTKCVVWHMPFKGIPHMSFRIGILPWNLEGLLFVIK